MGYAAYRSGNPARARVLFERALALLRATEDPDRLVTLSDLGAACAATGDHAAARQAHEAALQGRRAALGDRHPDIAASLHNLAATCRALADPDAAEACQREAVSIWRATLGDLHPMTAKGFAALGALALGRGDVPAAEAFAQQVLSIRLAILPADDPAIADALADLGAAQAAAGDDAAASRSFAAALARLAARGGPRAAALHVAGGMVHRRLGHEEAAAEQFTAALAIDPGLTTARHHLALSLMRLGRADEAAQHRDQALRAQPVFEQAGPPASPRVLILATSEPGNIPLEHILPDTRLTRIWWFIDHTDPERAGALPRYDIVFNAIGDPDMSARAQARAAHFAAICGTPMLNHPAAIAATRRDRLPALLAGIPDLATPRVCRIAGEPTREALMHAAAAAGITTPALLRPAGSHGGAGVVRLDDWAALDIAAAADSGAWYLSQFHDCRGADGFVRKYRVIFVGGEPFAYHLAISPDWLVHYYTAGMAGHAWKLAEEFRFLDDPLHALGAPAWAALHAAGARLDLAYGGMDFTLLPDGGVLIFEANATMLVHPERENGALAFKNGAVRRIGDAAWRMLVGEH